MNKNSTQKETRNFIAKLSNFFTHAPALPARPRMAGKFALLLSYTYSSIKNTTRSIINFTFISYHSGVEECPVLLTVRSKCNSNIFNLTTNAKQQLTGRYNTIKQY